MHPQGWDPAPDSGQIKANVIVQHFPAFMAKLTESIEELRQFKRLKPKSNDNKFNLMRKLTKVRQKCVALHKISYIYLHETEPKPVTEMT